MVETGVSVVEYEGLVVPDDVRVLLVVVVVVRETHVLREVVGDIVGVRDMEGERD
jgi:hypothetical protein